MRMLQDSGARPNELAELQTRSAGRATTWGKDLGDGLPAYVSTHAPVQAGKRNNLTLRENAACGLDQAFVDMVASIETVRLDSYSEKVNGPDSRGQGFTAALKAPRGDGILNVGCSRPS